jgi:four helix bundle protein
MSICRYENLDVYKQSFDLTFVVYEWTRSFPTEERYALSVQMHRAAASVPANIAEGFIRMRPRDKARFYNIAEASAEELSVFVRMATRLQYPGLPANLLLTVKNVAKMLRRLTNVTLAKA